MELKTFKLILAYDGTKYGGWQRQLNSDSVQQQLESALAKLYQTNITTVAAGRTDSGVHANGQVVSWRISSNIPANKLQRAINHFLPNDIRCLSVQETDNDFHALRSAVAKKYSYRFYIGGVLLPTLSRFVWAVPFKIDLPMIQVTLQHFHGTKDFAAFQASGGSCRSTIRTIYNMSINSEMVLGQEFWRLDVIGDGFLYHMVRNIIGTLMWVGNGRLKPGDIDGIMADGLRMLAGPTAPANGLCLEKVYYKGDKYGQ